MPMAWNKEDHEAAKVEALLHPRPRPLRDIYTLDAHHATMRNFMLKKISGFQVSLMMGREQFPDMNDDFDLLNRQAHELEIKVRAKIDALPHKK